MLTSGLRRFSFQRALAASRMKDWRPSGFAEALRPKFCIKKSSRDFIRQYSRRMSNARFREQSANIVMSDECRQIFHTKSETSTRSGRMQQQSRIICRHGSTTSVQPWEPLLCCPARCPSHFRRFSRSGLHWLNMVNGVAFCTLPANQMSSCPHAFTKSPSGTLRPGRATPPRLPSQRFGLPHPPTLYIGICILDHISSRMW